MSDFKVIKSVIDTINTLSKDIERRATRRLSISTDSNANSRANRFKTQQEQPKMGNNHPNPS